MTSNMQTVQRLLLEDHTHYDPNKPDNYHAILWATNNYTNHQPSDEMTSTAYTEIQPRCIKTQSIQDNRRKTRGEVFTPTWLCNRMNNYADNTHFNSNLFNTENQSDHTWTETHEYEKHSLSERDNYIQSRQLEITCGEAPFLVSPYESNTGDTIPISHRIGLLDRKLQWINSTTDTYDEWENLVILAYQTTYGFEYQGDSLLIARLNLLNTYCDYHVAQWDTSPSIENMETMSTIISWNLWQMDGLPDPATLKKHKKQSTEDTLTPRPQHSTHCMIRLWENTDPQEDTIPFSECEETSDDTLF